MLTIQFAPSTESCAEHVFTNKPHDDNGASCNFYKFKGYGIKVYTCEEVRDRAFEAQNSLADLGFAPEAYEKFDAANVQGAVIYAYTTELADTAVEAYADLYKMTVDEVYSELSEMRQNAYIDDHFAFMLEEMSNVNLGMYDVHIGNFGWVDGRAVVIDCGEW